jgi:pyroglutamyl-peptidase
MIAAINEAGLPGAISNTAGTFVCNDVLYSLLHHYAGTNVRCGFIHVPWLPEQGEPSLPLSDTVKALTAAVSAL